jgi:hypothetical protein
MKGKERQVALALTRRTFAGALVAAGGLALAGCGASQRGDPAKTADSNGMGTADGAPGAPQLAAMTVYRDPSCGCCEAWAEIARNAGYDVTVIDHPDMAGIKRQHGVPEELASCHTTLAGGYAIEGHVPLAAVARLLKERPGGLRGIAVPGMPRGSPGMEMPDGSKDPFQVIAFDAAGRTSVFSAG